MNKAILMSIQPKWLVKILNGEKTIEIRKTMPKCELPIDVYLYCTKGTLYFDSYENEWQTSKVDRKLLNPNLFHRNGKVVAKFTLTNIDEYEHYDNGYDFSKFICSKTNHIVFEDFKPTSFELKSCLEYEDIVTYAWNKEYGDLCIIKNLYAWHIDNLVIFDKPMELREFYKGFVFSEGYENGSYGVWKVKKVLTNALSRAPQSWQYVYVKGE